MLSVVTNEFSTNWLLNKGNLMFCGEAMRKKEKTLNGKPQIMKVSSLSALPAKSFPFVYLAIITLNC
jgi:hypothetical protein